MGPYFGDTPKTLTATIVPGKTRAGAKGLPLQLSGRASFDGLAVPMTVER